MVGKGLRKFGKAQEGWRFGGELGESLGGSLEEIAHL